MALRDVLVGFGIEIKGLDQIETLDNGIKKVIRGAELLGSALGAISITKMASEFITGTVAMGAKVVDTANRLGVGTDELQQFQYAASMVGVNADQAAMALGQLERRAGNAADGGKAGAKAFAQLGIDIRDTATGGVKPLVDLLPQVAKGLQKLNSDGQRLDYLTKLFGRQAQGLNALFRDPEALQKYVAEFKELGLGLGTDFLKAAKDAEKALTRLELKYQAFKSRLVIQVAPWLEKGIDKLLIFFGYMSSFADATNVAQTALISLGVAALAALSPLLVAIAPVVAEFTALYLIFDDIYTFLTGGDSLIGEVLDKLFGAGTGDAVASKIKTDVKELWDLFKDSLPTLKQFGDGLKAAFATASPILEGLLRGLGAFMELLIGGVKAMIEMKNAVETGDWSKVGKAIDKAGDAVFSPGGTFGKYLNFQPSNSTLDYLPNGGLPTLGPHSQVGSLPNGFIGPPQAPIGPPAPPVTIQQHNETTITVQGAKTNEETGRAVAGAAKSAQDASHREAAAALRGRTR